MLFLRLGLLKLRSAQSEIPRRAQLEGLARQPTGKALLLNGQVELASRNDWLYVSSRLTQLTQELIFGFSHSLKYKEAGNE